MNQAEIIEQIIGPAIEEYNDANGEDLQLSPELPLFGKDSKIDSLGLVSLIVEIENLLSEKYDVSVSLADEKAMSQTKSPFKNVDSLSNYILQLINASAS
ncbi:MAG: hypothetical protein H6626_10965 [Pseudobdellovibrionaceae bacterium]|nr:hypothetical protein [Bdellovibrionales bacterium]USN46724.1 MAG: hypothetical protein H6626_10965 [Pseudobdellovibrionaceae bacterium]